MKHYIYYATATVTRKYICSWKCCSCGKIHVEIPTLEGHGSVQITMFKDKAKAQAEANSRAIEDLQQKIDNLPMQVNQYQNIDLLSHCGTCSHCKTVQPWAKTRDFSTLIIISPILIFASMFVAGQQEIRWFFAGIAGMFGACILSSYLTKTSRNRAVRSLSDRHCQPLVVTSSIPDYIPRDDPRLIAIVQALVSMQTDKKST